MSIKLLILILSSVTLSAVAQLVLKLGASSARPGSSPGGASLLDGLHLMVNLRVAGGLCLYGLSALLWLLVLARVDLSFAYPFVGLGFILTMLFGFGFLGEPMTAARVIGTLMIVGGVAIIART